MRLFPNNLTLRQLRAYMAVVRNRSFVAAAKELFITPSALSETIRQLEDAVGVRLLDRTTRSVDTTAAGEEFFADMARTLEALELAVRRMSDFGSAHRGLVRVTGISSVLTRLTVPCVAQLTLSNPGIAFDIVEDGTSKIRSAVLEGSADIGIGVLSGAASDGLHVVPLVSDRFGIVAMKGHAAFKQKNLTVSSLAAWNYIGVPLSGELAQLLESSVIPRVRLNNLGMVLPLLVGTAGVSVFPYLGATRILTKQLAFKAFNSPAYVRHISLIRRQRRSLSPAAQLLWDLMAQSAATLLFAGSEPTNAGMVILPDSEIQSTEVGDK